MRSPSYNLILHIFLIEHSGKFMERIFIEHSMRIFWYKIKCRRLTQNLDNINVDVVGDHRGPVSSKFLYFS